MSNDTGNNNMQGGSGEHNVDTLKQQEDTVSQQKSLATPASSGQKAKIRQWRVGTFSMGVTLIALGILLILGKLYELPVLLYIMKLWPVLLVVLGLEMVVYNTLANTRGGAVRFVYDVFSIFLVVVFLVFSAGLYFLESMGVLEMAQRFLLTGPPFVEQEIIGLWTAEEDFLETYQVEPGTELTVKNINGSITVQAWNEDHVEVYALKQSRLGSAELEKVHVRVDTHAGLVIATEHLTPHPRISVRYEIRVPAHVLVTSLQSSNGSVEVEGTSGDLAVSTSNGKITISNVDGIVSARTSNGKINVSRVSGISGLRTSNGNIEAEFQHIAGAVDITSSNGSITLLVPPGLGADLEARTSNGKISVSNLPFESSVMDSSYLKGRLGSGGNKLSIKTSNGSIKIDRL